MQSEFDINQLVISMSECMRSINRPVHYGSHYINDAKIPTVLVGGRRMLYRSVWEAHLDKLRAKGKLPNRTSEGATPQVSEAK